MYTLNYNSPHQNADIHWALGEREPGKINLSEQVEHVGMSNVAMFASLVPRLSVGGERESLVHTVCACF